ncbi:MAG: polysaccharide pyruvyl transferase family protein, partial [Chlorobium sp.]|nr:polysaccharide pyruvyl transferase family protein [Chlorobium sp.]
MTDNIKPKLKASLFYLYGQRNAGDAAICLGALSFLIKKGFAVTAFSRWPNPSPEYQTDFNHYSTHFEDVTIEGSPFLFKRVRNIPLLLFYYGMSFFRLFFSSSARKIMSTIKGSDLVILNGGNLLRCQSVTDFIRLVGFLYPLCLARYYKVSYVIFPQSTVEVNAIGKILLRYVFSDAKGIWVREKESLEKFSILFPDVNFLFAPDMAFHIPCPAMIHGDVMDKDCIKVAMTVRSHTIGDANEFEVEKQGEIIKTLSYIIDRISTRYKISLTFVVQCDKDLKITKEVQKNIQEKKIANLQGCEIYDSRNNHDLLLF